MSLYNRTRAPIHNIIDIHTTPSVVIYLYNKLRLIRSRVRRNCVTSRQGWISGANLETHDASPASEGVVSFR
jgi:hypothetical protein